MVGDPTTEAGGGAPNDDTIKIVNSLSSNRTTSPTGGGNGHNHSIGAQNHLPPYYALAFIMYVGV